MVSLVQADHPAFAFSFVLLEAECFGHRSAEMRVGGPRWLENNYRRVILITSLLAQEISLSGTVNFARLYARCLYTGRYTHPALSTALLSQLQPHREALFQAETVALQSRKARHRCPMEGNWRSAQHLHTRGMLKLLRLMRACKHLNRKCPGATKNSSKNIPSNPQSRGSFRSNSFHAWVT
jgi:hypothetical protein